MRDKIEFALNCLKTAARSGYGDARFVLLKQRQLSAKNGHPSMWEEKESAGIGIRVLIGGAWGFASTSDISKQSIERAVSGAVKIARAASVLNRRRIQLAAAPAVRRNWETPVVKDPWSMDPAAIMDYLVRCDKILRKDKRIRWSESRADFIRKEQIFASTEGSWIESARTITGGGIQCRAKKGAEIQKRSFPCPSRDHHAGGYEVIERLDLEGHAARIRDEAVALLSAKACPDARTSLILKDSLLALTIHESIGHGSELDRVFGYEDNLGGRTFLLPSKKEKQVASPAVTLVANRRSETSAAGYLLFDDEGIPAKETEIVRSGVFLNYLSSRETAREAAAPLTGSVIAEDFSAMPLVRMTTLSLLPGNNSAESILGGVRDGLLMDTESSWSIDQERKDFQLGAEIAWRIKNGKIAGIYKNPLFRAVSEPFWKSCEAVAGDGWKITGFPDCGKGGPIQNAFVSHGCSPALFKGVRCYAAAV